MNMDKFFRETEETLGRLWEDSQSTEEKERFLLAIDALKFISDTGQSPDFADYRKSLDDNAPPLVIAAFKTREEADAWLNAAPKPQYPASVLISGEYYLVMDHPRLKQRRLVPKPRLEFYLAGMISEGIPAPVATFNTHEEAEAWLQNQPEPPRQVFIQIAGEYHLVVYHHRVNLRAIYPISKAAKLEQKGEADE